MHIPESSERKVASFSSPPRAVMQDFGAHIIIKKTQAQEYYMPIKALQCLCCVLQEETRQFPFPTWMHFGQR